MMKRLMLVSVILAANISCTMLDEKSEQSPSTQQITFTEVTQQIGLNTPDTWKYGGPSIADMDNNGVYDFILGSHDKEPAFLLLGEPCLHDTPKLGI